jgi:hypothetical protein
MHELVGMHACKQKDQTQKQTARHYSCQHTTDAVLLTLQTAPDQGVMHANSLHYHRMGCAC